MITLYTFGSNFNLPDPSPFVMKTEVLLKMAKLPYQTDSTGDSRKAPKGKFPYLIDEGKAIADSSFIRFYLEDVYQVDFDSDCDRTCLPSAFLAEKYCEDNLYFLVLSERWLNQENFEKGPKTFFQIVPWLMRPLIIKKVRKDIEQTLWLQGLGRHSPAEKIRLVEKGSSMLAKLLDQKPFFGGEQPCGSDASIFALFYNILNDFFDCPYRQLFANHDNLVQYTKRMIQLYYPSYEPKF